MRLDFTCEGEAEDADVQKIDAKIYFPFNRKFDVGVAIIEKFPEGGDVGLVLKGQENVVYVPFV